MCVNTRWSGPGLCARELADSLAGLISSQLLGGIQSANDPILFRSSPKRITFARSHPRRTHLTRQVLRGHVEYYRIDLLGWPPDTPPQSTTDGKRKAGAIAADHNTPSSFSQRRDN